MEAIGLYVSVPIEEIEQQRCHSLLPIFRQFAHSRDGVTQLHTLALTRAPSAPNH